MLTVNNSDIFISLFQSYHLDIFDVMCMTYIEFSLSDFACYSEEFVAEVVPLKEVVSSAIS